MEKKYFVEFGKNHNNRTIIPIVCKSDEQAKEVAIAICRGAIDYPHIYCEVFDADVAYEIAKGNAINGKSNSGYYELICDCM